MKIMEAEEIPIGEDEDVIENPMKQKYLQLQEMLKSYNTTENDSISNAL